MSRCDKTSKVGKHKHLCIKSLGMVLEWLRSVEHKVDMSLFIETNIYFLEFFLWDCFSKLRCIDSSSNSDSSLEKSIVPTFLEWLVHLALPLMHPTHFHIHLC
jgi:hypothetical protein